MGRREEPRWGRRMSPRVVVVGGGLAGIVAALDLADRGSEVVLLEAHGRLGGRTWSFERNGHRFDNGQHVFLRCCTAYRAFLDRIHVADQVDLQARLDIPVLTPDGKRARLRSAPLPAPLHLAPSLGRYRHLSFGNRMRLGPAASALRKLDPADPALDRQSFGDWLTDHHQSRAAVERLWDLIVRPTVNLPATDASLALAVKVFRTGLLDDRAGADIGWSTVPLAELHGTAAMQALEAAGVDVRLHVRVGALVASRDSVAGVSVAGPARTHDTGELVPADVVILAVPPHAAARLLRDHVGMPNHADLLQLGSSPIVNVHLVLDRRVTDAPIAAAVGSPVQFVFDRSTAAGVAPAQQCLVSSISAADAEIGKPSARLIAEHVAALRTLLPGMRRANVVDAVVTRERAATFRGVPATMALRPGPRTDVPGLFIAGSWIATGWPDTMESAVRSGHLAAAAAAERDLAANVREPTEVPA